MSLKFLNSNNIFCLFTGNKTDEKKNSEAGYGQHFRCVDYKLSVSNVPISILIYAHILFHKCAFLPNRYLKLAAARHIKE